MFLKGGENALLNKKVAHSTASKLKITSENSDFDFQNTKNKKAFLPMEDQPSSRPNSKRLTAYPVMSCIQGVSCRMELSHNALCAGEFRTLWARLHLATATSLRILI